MRLKSLFKKNQLMITALAIMIAIAGYLQFAGNGLEEEYLVVNDAETFEEGKSTSGSGVVISETLDTDTLLDLSEEDLLQTGLTEMESLDSETEGILVENYISDGMQEAIPKDGEIPGEAVFTSSANGVTVISEAKLLKEQTRAKNKETLMQIIGSETLNDEQKQEAVDHMVEMTAIAEKESACEILLEAKGFSDVVVSLNGDAVDVVVNASVLDDAMRAQIEDIVRRKTQVRPENIVISTVK